LVGQLNSQYFLKQAADLPTPLYSPLISLRQCGVLSSESEVFKNLSASQSVTPHLCEMWGRSRTALAHHLELGGAVPLKYEEAAPLGRLPAPRAGGQTQARDQMHAFRSLGHCANRVAFFHHPPSLAESLALLLRRGEFNLIGEPRCGGFVACKKGEKVRLGFVDQLLDRPQACRLPPGPQHADWIIHVTWSAHGKYLVTGSGDNRDIAPSLDGLTVTG
jgi:hypothetical protein